jgi:hypothetical protein
VKPKKSKQFAELRTITIQQFYQQREKRIKQHMKCIVNMLLKIIYFINFGINFLNNTKVELRKKVREIKVRKKLERFLEEYFSLLRNDHKLNGLQ